MDQQCSTLARAMKRLTSRGESPQGGGHMIREETRGQQGQACSLRNRSTPETHC
jgi:hypothetical protein